ncbi:reverse transcriptase [Perkinsela sp. CCAP 1560/4]|nr:reverse transcriptase [Perkinsela sp. CCAP 1560/4]|eukprot:KNH06338.1 reverse transcriptase [Perkinsela sp. CCAP 1560/4]
MDDAVKKKVSGEAVSHRHPADYEIWTDGSYAEETSSVVGAALIFKKGRANYQTVSVGGNWCSSFRSECLALHAGLRRVIADKLLHRGKRLLVATDSQSLLMALKSHAACETTSTSAECAQQPGWARCINQTGQTGGISSLFIISPMTISKSNFRKHRQRGNLRVACLQSSRRIACRIWERIFEHLLKRVTTHIPK